MLAPFIEGRIYGGQGWLFPKRSPFLPIFNKYYMEIKEAGHLYRISRQPKYDPTYLLPQQECGDLDGHPISMHKVISLFVLIFGTVFLSVMIFW